MPRRPPQKRTCKRKRGNDGGAVIIPVMEHFTSRSLPPGQRITLEPSSFTNRGIFTNGKQSKSCPMSREVIGEIDNPFQVHGGTYTPQAKRHRFEEIPPSPSSAFSACSLHRRRQEQAQALRSDASHDVWRCAGAKNHSLGSGETAQATSFEEGQENRMWPVMKLAPGLQPEPIEQQKQRSNFVPARPSIDDLIQACENGYFGDDSEREQDDQQDAGLQEAEPNDHRRDNDNPSLGDLSDWLQKILEPSEFKEDVPDNTPIDGISKDVPNDDRNNEQQHEDILNDSNQFHDNYSHDESHLAPTSPKSSHTSVFNQSHFSSLLLGEALYTPSSVTSTFDSLQLPFDLDTNTLLLDDDCISTGTATGQVCGPVSVDQLDPVGKWFWKSRSVPISLRY